MRRRPERHGPGALARLCAIAGLLAGASWTAAQEAPPARAESPPAAPEAISPPGKAAPEPPADAISSYQTRAYKVKPKKLWKGLLETLATAGYPPEEVDEKAMKVKTSFVDFDAKEFSENVADPPPNLTPTYQVLQMAQVRQGKVSLEAVLVQADGGTTLSLRARILVQGLDRRTRQLVLTDRRSSGVIEDAFFEKLEDGLGLERA